MLETTELLKDLSKTNYGIKTDDYLTIASIDIETNGLSKTTDDVLTFGYALCKYYQSKTKMFDKGIQMETGKYIVGLEIIECNDLYLCYKGLEKVGRYDIHGITLDMMKEHESEFDYNLAKMCAIMSSYVIVTKNGWTFDMPFIVNYALRFGTAIDTNRINLIELQDIMTKDFQIENGYVGTRKKGTLSEYVEWMNSKAPAEEKFTFRAHNSLEDAKATAWTFYRFMGGVDARA